MAPQIVHTVAFHTRDARVDPARGAYTWTLPGDVPRFKATKVQLGSLEMPLVQYGVEAMWNRFYWNEGHRLDDDDTRALALTVHPAGAAAEHVTVRLPLHLMPIASWHKEVRSDGTHRWVATCVEPHALPPSSQWVPGTRLVGTAWSDGVWLDAAAVSVRSATEFVVDGLSESAAGAARGRPGGWLHVPSPASPGELVAALDAALARALESTPLRLRLEYDAATNRVGATAGATAAAHLSIHPTRLSRLLGLGSLDRSISVGVGTLAAGPCHDPTIVRQRVEVPTDGMGWWGHVELSPGWYTPSHRPMATGQPLRFERELETALNRFYFPLPERVSNGAITGHFLVFIDPLGATHSVPVPCGMHSASSLARILGDGMTRACTASGVVFDVRYQDDECRFVFEARREMRGAPPPAFTLLLNHPMQFDPSRIGFSPLVYAGSALYASVHPCRCPAAASGDATLANVYRVHELAAQKRFRFHASTPPHTTGVIEAYADDDAAAEVAAGGAVLTLRTHLSTLPFAHGLRVGDLVTLQELDASGAIEVMAPTSQQGWTDATAAPCALLDAIEGVVLPPPATAAAAQAPAAAETACRVRLAVRPSSALADHVGQALLVQRQTTPFNICTGCLPRSLAHTHLGLRPGASQWGVDGAAQVRADGYRVAPFEAPHVHALDPPDYLLIYLDEGKRGTLLQHAYGNDTTTPLAKMVLTPLFRDERMLPRDSTMLSGESLSNFTLRFLNPDGRTPYNFHGAEFSLSLNLIKADSD